MPNEFRTALWICSDCGRSASERVHPKTDGDLTKLPPPDGWSQTGDAPPYDLVCPSCIKKHELAVQRTTAAKTDASIATITYRGMPREEALANWREQHICLQCTNKPVCKFAHTDLPDSSVCQTITRCKAFRMLTD